MTGADAGGATTEHATAIVVGQTGLLFIGASGAGKSSTAFACLNAAIRRGWNAALIADDRTRLNAHSGRLIASCPAPLRGLIEIRGTGLLRMRRLDRAVMHLAVAPGEPSADSRLPAESETFAHQGTELPLLRLWRNGAVDPLSALCALRPDCFFGN
ncbi:HPr kinase/phosphatase C-terminal domain-containing protein [uncultured Hoeflea sp.]|uniref:HPr kinase/phosphorylase n=1 Tax=uncultured Hoeflea sp. TaxID=538666 RepID=UPI0026146260|nr:HPr kinase/phosphatase C-terminal domain-containing protein [uncultured Hoeflea sp.]